MLNISSPYFYPKPNVNFKCHTGFTEVKTAENKKMKVQNYTTFFRNYPTLEFTKDYLLKNFPQGTKLSEFGCSTGQKPYSLMIIMDKYNKDNKYKMTGYDFPEVIEKTKIPLFGINSFTREEQLLFESYDNSELFGEKYIACEKAKEYRKTFFKYFEKYEPEHPLTGYRYNLLKELIRKNPNGNSQGIQEAKEDLVWLELIRKCTDVVKAKDNAKNLVQFKAGDINYIDRLLNPKENGVIIFQNALYHILAGGLDYEIDDLEKNIGRAESIFKKVNKVLPKNGIFVLGNLPSDHIYDFNREEKAHLHYQEGKCIKVYDESPIHRVLKENGFEPVFFERVPYDTAYINNKDIHLPAVWKKVRDI